MRTSVTALGPAAPALRRPFKRSASSRRGLSDAAKNPTGRICRTLEANARASDEIEGWAPAGDVGWELEPPGSSEDEGDLDLFPPAEGGWGGPGYFLQNAVAVGLVALLALAAGDVLLKLLVVAYSLVAAGFRYTVIALLLLVLMSLFK